MGDVAEVWQRQMPAGVFLVETRETDVDVRMIVDAAGRHAELEDEVGRHGHKAMVVVLPEPGPIRVALRNLDYRTMKGSVALRVIRLRDSDASPSPREHGLSQLGAAGELLALGTPEARAKSREHLRMAIRHFTAAKDVAARADARYALACVEYFLHTDYPDGVVAAEEARDDYETAGDIVGVHNALAMRATIDIEIAWLMNAVGRRAEQLERFRKIDEQLRGAEEFFASRGMAVREQYMTNMRGIGILYSGDDHRAIDFFKNAAKLARARDDVIERTKSLQNVAWTKMRLGYLEQSAREMEDLLARDSFSGHPRNYAQWLTNYGIIAIAIGEFDRALAAQTEAHQIFEAQGMIQERANALVSIGYIYLRIGDLDRARETLKTACAELEQIQDYAGLPPGLRGAGNVAAALGDYKEALGYLRRAAEIEANPVGLARTQVMISRTLRQMGDLRGAEKALGAGFTIDNPLVQANALHERGLLWAARGDTGRAVRDLRAAESAFATLGVDLLRIETNAALSQALLARGDIAGAVTAADLAIDIEGGIRMKSANPEWRASFLSDRYAPYEARIAAELVGDARDPARIWRAFQIAERIRARAMVEPLAPSEATSRNPPADAEALRATLTAQLGRLESRLHRAGPDDRIVIELRRSAEVTRARLLGVVARNPASTAAAVLPESLDRVQASLPDDVAVLAFFAGDAKTDVWLLTARELRHARTSGAKSLQARVRSFVEDLRVPRAPNSAAKLADVLLGNLLDGVAATRLVIVPDGPLNGLPFAALPLPGGSGKLLIDRFTISTSPSLALALSGAPPAPERPLRVAVVADPVYSLIDRRLATGPEAEGARTRGTLPLVRLPYSAVEARAVVKAFTGDDAIVLSGFDANASRVLDLQSQDLRVLHFATHARGTTAPENSVLFLSRFGSDGAPLSRDALTADDIAHSQLRADLVVLSGCATGQGRELRGGGVLGLTHGFLANGSRSVIASLWPIEDAATARFMEEFYTAFRKSGRAAEALRIAQLRTRDGPSNAVWSSFVVRANELP
jgi:CHAT domain-containing protein/tetratricopeptide (TPR) repeat protein